MQYIVFFIPCFLIILVHLIQQTSAGKTHFLWMLGVMERGIILIFIPLLTLSADVMPKFKCTNPHFGAVVIHHLDKIYDANR